MSECMSWFLPGLVWRSMFAFHRLAIDPVTASCGRRPSLCRSDRSDPKAALRKKSAERGDWSSSVVTVHPGDYGRIVDPAAIRDGTAWCGVSIGGLEQPELAGAGHRRSAVLNTHFAIQGALVGLHGVQ